MRRRKTLRERIEARIARNKRDDVFLPREFADLGGEDQVLRVLRSLVREGQLVRLGYGVYGRAVISQRSGEPILYSPNGFPGAARQAHTKLGVQWEPTEAERAEASSAIAAGAVEPALQLVPQAADKTVWLCVNAGRYHGIRARAIVGAMAHQADVRGPARGLSIFLLT